MSSLCIASYERPCTTLSTAVVFNFTTGTRHKCNIFDIVHNTLLKCSLSKPCAAFYTLYSKLYNLYTLYSIHLPPSLLSVMFATYHTNPCDGSCVSNELARLVRDFRNVSYGVSPWEGSGYERSY